MKGLIIRRTDRLENRSGVIFTEVINDALGVDKSLREYKIRKRTKETLIYTLKPSNKIKVSGKTGRSRVHRSISSISTLISTSTTFQDARC